MKRTIAALLLPLVSLATAGCCQTTRLFVINRTSEPRAIHLEQTGTEPRQEPRSAAAEGDPALPGESRSGGRVLFQPGHHLTLSLPQHMGRWLRWTILDPTTNREIESGTLDLESHPGDLPITR